MPVGEAVYVAPRGEEVAVPRLYHGRRPQTGVGDPLYGVWPVVYEAEGAKSLQDAELVFRRNCKPHAGAEMGFQPGFEMRGHNLGIVVGYEMNPYVLFFLQCAQHLWGARIRFPVPDALGVEDAVEDGGRCLFAVGVEDVGPGGDPIRIECLACDVEDAEQTQAPVSQMVESTSAQRVGFKVLSAPRRGSPR